MIWDEMAKQERVNAIILGAINAKCWGMNKTKKDYAAAKKVKNDNEGLYWDNCIANSSKY